MASPNFHFISNTLGARKSKPKSMNFGLELVMTEGRSPVLYTRSCSSLLFSLFFFLFGLRENTHVRK